MPHSVHTEYVPSSLGQTDAFRARMRSYEASSRVRGIEPARAAARSAWYVAWVDASEPVTRIMSVPAIAARMASADTGIPRALAVPDRESVIVTPRNPSWSRRGPVTIARDQPAPFTGS